MRQLVDFQDYRWLVGDTAGRVLAELASLADGLVRAASRLRGDFSATQMHLLLQQIDLRRRARHKFADADHMFFTPLGLEQATDQWIATHKAPRFRPSSGLLWDLCCGIGGDLQALVRQCRAVGVDRDRIAALLAKANCPSQTEVVVADAAHLPAEIAAWHIDPDRRPAGRRTTHVERHQPDLPMIEELLRFCPTGAVKLAPATELPERWCEEAELEWISRDGECKQLVAWFGRLAKSPGRRCATMVLGRELPPKSRSFMGDSHLLAPVMARFGRYLAEPDAAVLAAGLVGALAAEQALSAIAPGAAYLTGDRPGFDPALAWFEIEDVLPFDIKRIKAILRQRCIGRLEIKKRGVVVEPEQLRRQLRVPGEEQATLFLARQGATITALLTRRLPRVLYAVDHASKTCFLNRK